MPIIDVVKWDGTPELFAYKFPEENLTTGTQLIVHESQEAVLFSKGKLLQLFTAGKHTLSTENIPVLEHLYGIPFGGKNPFHAEIWFVNKTMNLDMKWGTPTPIQLKDPLYEVLLPVRANGQMGIQIVDAKSFLIKLVGTLPIFSSRQLTPYFRGILLSHIGSSISRKILKERISLLEISAHLVELSQEIKSVIIDKLTDYGVRLVDFHINSINVPEEDPTVIRLKQLLSEKAEMELLGFNYYDRRSFDVLENASKNEGASGSIINAGMGMGMGWGMGGTIAEMMQQMEQKRQQHNHEATSCPHCHAKTTPDSNFCPQCGKELQLICKQCEKQLPPGSKFCSFCGEKTTNE